MVSKDSVLKLFHSLKTDKDTGLDSIPSLPAYFKDIAVEISPILTFIFQQSLDTGLIPSEWRSANITPIYKKLLSCVSHQSRVLNIIFRHVMEN